MDLAVAVPYFQLVQAAAALALGWRLLHLRLGRTMPFIILLQFWTVVSSGLTIWLFSSQPLYRIFFSVVIPLNCVINILAVRNVIALVFTRYPGIRTVGRWMMYGSVTVSVMASLLVAKVFWTNSYQKGVLKWVLLERSVSFSLALIILCILFCLSRYPLRLPINFSISSSLFCVIFLTESLVMLLATTLKRTSHNPLMDVSQTAIVVACLLYWTWMLQPAHSALNATPPLPERNLDHEDNLLAQLDQLNRVMSRAAGG